MHQRSVLSQHSAGQADLATPAVAPHTWAPANVMALQATIGNRALSRAIAAGRVEASPPPRPATRVLARLPTGLRRSKKVNEFADDALTWWRDPANKDKPLEDYAKHLMAKVNTMLKALQSAECKYVIDRAGSASGTFGRTTWTITINPDKFSKRTNVTKVSDLTAKEAAEIADTIYHESRHSEQYFRIARVQAGRLTPGTKNPGAKIATDMSIPSDVADAAAKSPLKATEDNTAELAEIEDWESITVGRHEDYKGIINDWGNEADALDDEINGVKAANVDAVKTKLESTLADWKKKATRQKFVKSHLAKTQKLKTQTTVDNNVVNYLTDIQAKLATLNTAAAAALKNWKKANAAAQLLRLEGLKSATKGLRSALYQAYKGHIHEEDAWATGGAVGTRFRGEQAMKVAAEKAAAKKAAAEKAKKAAAAKAKKAAAAKKKKQAPAKKKTAATTEKQTAEAMTADVVATPIAEDAILELPIVSDASPAVEAEPVAVAVGVIDEELDETEDTA